MTDDLLPAIPPHFSPGNREAITDHYVPKNVLDETVAFKFKVFIRLNASKIKFKNVSFEHSVFDGCYFRSCVFDSCNFTGCRFIGSNLHQSSFPGSRFDYATFERCQIDSDILTAWSPREENLKMRFARSLRMNFQQVGDAKAVNEAITQELDATSRHLLESWLSEDEFHRKKYRGLQRIRQFLAWVEFWVLHFVWGNGESITKLLRTIIIAMVAIAVYDANASNGSATILDYLGSLKDAPAIFLGTISRSFHTTAAASMIVAARLIALSLLTALLVKRFGRR
ncbi:pentapeptide repeat-containing protein [Acidovorax sp. SUPP1855]|uniref:pentapeptide repeat-containing protein n=1 Tax=Acidovorax sp. SUPP1855 TaxID=431774 RepID=UPI0023DE699E|nr:pentapeptide repeat-containing protein [Acidovorax sp. SUPP1855]GKS85916.1 pentapeptide repeat-containing protein [Acidovorax sp. SUPP1855]